MVENDYFLSSLMTPDCKKLIGHKTDISKCDVTIYWIRQKLSDFPKLKIEKRVENEKIKNKIELKAKTVVLSQLLDDVASSIYSIFRLFSFIFSTFTFLHFSFDWKLFLTNNSKLFFDFRITYNLWVIVNF